MFQALSHLPTGRYCHNALTMRFRTLSILILAVTLAGCQAGLSDKDFVGNWSSKVTITDAALLKQIKAMGGSDKDLPMAKQMLGNAKVALELKADKTYVMSQGAGNIEGKWAFAAPKMTLTPTKIAGMDVKEFVKNAPMAKAQADPMSLDVDKEGKTISGTSQEATLSFTKAPTEPAK